MTTEATTNSTPTVEAALGTENGQQVERVITEATSEIRADAVKAVEEVLRAAEGGETSTKKPTEDPEAPDAPGQKGDATATAESAPSKPKGIGDILAAREKAAEPKTEAQKLLDEARKAQDEIKQAQAEIAKDRAAIAADRAKLEKLKDVRNAPEALKELGWEPEEFVTTAAEANTPIGKLQALVRSQAEQIAKLSGKADAWEKEAEETKTKAQKHAEEQAQRQVEESFQKLAFDGEKYPSLTRLYGDDDEDKQVLLMKAHNVARRYRAATGGEEATFEQIADYLEERAQAKLAADAKEEKASKNGKAQPGGRPAGKRTLNGSDASVRTSTPVTAKVTDDLDELGRRARQAAERAIRESGA